MEHYLVDQLPDRLEKVGVSSERVYYNTPEAPIIFALRVGHPDPHHLIGKRVACTTQRKYGKRSLAAAPHVGKKNLFVYVDTIHEPHDRDLVAPISTLYTRPPRHQTAPGRPPVEEGIARKLIKIKASDAEVQILRKLGNGNISEGLRTALKMLETH